MEINPDGLLELAQYLSAGHYQFTTITPASHACVLSRPQPERLSLRDIFGWNRDFKIEEINSEVRRYLEKAGALQKSADGHFKSGVRFSTLGKQLFAHSSFPTEDDESVFFGPDTYRFVRFLQANLREKVARAIDLGTGTGAGGLSIADYWQELVLSDVNETALRLTNLNVKINTPASGNKIKVLKSDLFEKVEGLFDLVIANPPFIADSSARKYRDGGDQQGLELTKKMIKQSLPRLNPGGKLILYTGVSFYSGHPGHSDYSEQACESGCDPLRLFLNQLDPDYRIQYEEIDPDIFGEELKTPNYKSVERIAAVGLVLERK